MIQIYANGGLVIDTRVKEYAITGLTTTTGLNKSGTAVITMPPGHPAYDAFVSYRTLVKIYENGERIFRGRALYPDDDFDNNRTITCEGERGFFQDTVMRPYLYQTTPEAIFRDIVAIHNAQTDEDKRFIIGEVDVTDPNNYVRFESESAEQTGATLDKLVERCGGYIIFTENEDGASVIHWLEKLAYANNQVIEFGANLLDFARSDASPDLATRIVPYGAKDETTGKRVTIESVNGGLDYIQDDEAVKLRGIICKPVFWDDVTEPQNLLTKAKQHLAQSKMIITSLELSAFDLSLLDKSLDSFREGDIIRVRSVPHGLDETFQLTDKTRNHLDPSDGKITMGKEVATLTGAGVSADRKVTGAIGNVERQILNAYNVNLGNELAALELKLTTLIEQTSEEIRLEVSKTYASDDEVAESISTSMTQLSDSFEFLFSELRSTVEANDAAARDHYEEQKKYIRFEDGNIVLGESGNEITLRIENDRISFLSSGAEVAYFSNNQLTVLDGTFLNSLMIGKFAFLPRENGNLSLVKVGD